SYFNSFWFYRRERELLVYKQELAAAKASGLLAQQVLPQSGAELLSRLRQTQDQVTVGGALYRADGSLVGTFGEPPNLTFAEVAKGQLGRFSRAQRRYDAPWEMSPLEGQYLLIIRHDTTAVRQAVIAFIGRIAGLVLIISFFVTGATMIVLERLLITPVLRLRRDLLQAGRAISADQDARLIKFEAAKTYRQDELGDVVSAFELMLQQISEAIANQQQAEAELRLSEEKFSKAFRASPNPITISTLVDGRLIEVNDSFLQLHGSRLEQVINQTALDLRLWAAPRDRQQMIQTIRDRGFIRNQEYQFLTRAQAVRTVLYSAEQISINSQDCILSVISDITERKQAEAAVARLAEIGELAAMIVHEVRNPLTTVLMGLSSFKRLNLPERAQMRLAFALEESERLQRLLNEILLYAKEQTLALDALDLNGLLQEMLTSLLAMPSASDRAIHLIPSEQPAIVLGDIDKLKQVFINLISNACEAIAAGERVTCQIEVTPRQQAIVRVHNGGEPIPLEVLPKLTQPFFTTKSSGNGLGLAITKRIIEAHRGELAIASTCAGGTTVTITFPLKPAQA
ncbi:MAG: PAS domain S-box protein, partial [Leptolyngbyaceae cyanobacterium SM1_1_3]|nr:PAS domain S-box protein [Leptolyngbyaceae cyanobacterium SM1_1_3]